MIKSLMLVAALFVAAAVPSYASSHLKSIEASTVTLDMYVDVSYNGSTQIVPAQCTAVLVGAGDNKYTEFGALTASHCVNPHAEMTSDGGTVYITPEEQTITASFFDGDTGVYEGQALNFGSRDDIAYIVIHSNRQHRTFARPSFTNVTRGEHLDVFGDPPAGEWLLQQAYATDGTTEMSDSAYPMWTHAYMVECAACGPGDSGAGVWDDQGRLAGIFVAKGDDYGYYIPSSRILEILGK